MNVRVCLLNLFGCFVPQIITSEEAERRGHVYDCQGATYLFDLDYVEDVYTVDAAHQGNVSHFVNHSVSGPACTVFCLWNRTQQEASVDPTLGKSV